MKKNLINDIFGCSEDEFTKVMNGWAKVYEDIFGVSEKDDEDENCEKDKDYLRVKGYRYDNGKLVEKYDKEYVDGECTKDEEFNAEKTVEDKTDACKCKNDGCKCNEEKCSRDEDVKRKARFYARIRKENVSLREQVDEMRHYIDGLNDKIKSLEMEKAELKNVIDNIKKCF